MSELLSGLFIVTLSLAVISLGGIILNFIVTRKSNNVTRNYFENDMIMRQVEVLEKSSDRIYRSDYGKQIIECIKNDTQHPILKDNGGNVTERELENFLNDILHLLFMKDLKAVHPALIARNFGWVLEKIQHSPEILSYIKKVQTLQHGPYYQSIIGADFT